MSKFYVSAIVSVLFAAGVCAVPLAASAEGYPDRPIKVIVAYPPGGTSSAIGRLIGEKMGQLLNTTVVIENRGGGSGTIGTAAVARSEPDGYTLLYATNNELSFAPGLQKVPYDPVTSFEPITLTATFPLVLVTRKDFPANNLKELVELARQKPGTITFGSVGVGSVSHLILEPLMSTFKIKVQHVPYRGGAPLATDLLGGHVDASFATPSTVASQVREGSLKAILTTGKKRNKMLPDTPAAGELGLDDLVVVAWNAFLAPAGTPKDIVNKLHQAAVTAAHDPAIVAQVAKIGSEIETSTPDELRATIRTEFGTWSKIIKDAGIKLE